MRFDPQGNGGTYVGASYGGAVVVAAPNITPNINIALAHGATIAGRVTAADTGTPLPDIDVVIYDSSGEAIAWATTGPDGTYMTERRLQPWHVSRWLQRLWQCFQTMRPRSTINKASLAAADSVTVSGATNIVPASMQHCSRAA